MDPETPVEELVRFVSAMTYSDVLRCTTHNVQKGLSPDLLLLLAFHGVIRQNAGLQDMQFSISEDLNTWKKTTIGPFE